MIWVFENLSSCTEFMCAPAININVLIETISSHAVPFATLLMIRMARDALWQNPLEKSPGRKSPRVSPGAFLSKGSFFFD